MNVNLTEILRLCFPLGTRKRQVWWSAYNFWRLCRAYWDISWGFCMISHSILVFMLFGLKSSLSRAWSPQLSSPGAMPLSAFHSSPLCTYFPTSLVFTWWLQDPADMGWSIKVRLWPLPLQLYPCVSRRRTGLLVETKLWLRNQAVPRLS